MPRQGSTRRSIAAYMFVAAAFMLGVFGVDKLRERTVEPFTSLVLRAPQVEHLAKFSGNGFHKGADEFVVAKRGSERGLTSRAPMKASGDFEATYGPQGSPLGLVLSINGTADVSGIQSKGAVLYEEVLPGTSVVSVADSKRLEMMFVVEDLSAYEPPVIDVRSSRRSDRMVSARDGSLLVRSAEGRPVLALSRPVAVDRNGRSREGRYVSKGEESYAVDVEMGGLVPPVVIDPAVHIPHWTLLEDHSQPGARSYYPSRGSRQNRVVYDPGQGQVLLVRPNRTQQHEDVAHLMGSQVIWNTDVRTPGSGVGAKTSTADEVARWTSTHRGESETWKLGANGWRRGEATGLPGFIDFDLAHVPALGSVLAFSGARTSLNCGHILGVEYASCRPDHDGATKVYALRDGGWQALRIGGGPSARIRASAGRFRDQLIVFGGRLLLDEFTVSDEPPPRPHAFPLYRYPDRVARDLANDTHLFDGERWKLVPVQHAPPAKENAQIVYDERRGRAVLVGGISDEGGDLLTIHEFDGIDWSLVLDQNSPEIPRDLLGRKDMSAFWHPVRQTTLLFGGNFKSLSQCPHSDEEATHMVALDPTLESSLTEAGCLGGYAHDVWEWNGTALSRLTDVEFAGYEDGSAVFSQVGDEPWLSASGSFVDTPPPAQPLEPKQLAERFDPRDKHFLLRSAHETAFNRDSTVAETRPLVETNTSVPVDTEFRSPIFASVGRMDAAFDAVGGRVVLVHPSDGRTIRTNGVSWSFDQEESPFSRGPSDFIASAWDSVRKQIVVFEPRDASTWIHEGETWTRATVGTSPPSSPSIPRVDDDLPYYGRVSYSSGHSFDEQITRTATLLSVPRMAFDHGRGRAVMIYSDAIWEFDGTDWLEMPLPADLQGCDAATLIAYDSSRERTVVVGCRVPGQTWEWDGASWFGPGGSPFQGLVQQWDNANINLATAVLGTVELDWAHPDALFFSSSLGGVAILDNDGHIRVWDGAAWNQGARLFGERLGGSNYGVVLNLTRPWMGDAKSAVHSGHTGLKVLALWHARKTPFSHRVFHPDLLAPKDINSYLPTVFYPPGFEDPNSNNVVIFRDDGSSGMRELRAEDGHSQWHLTELGGDAIYPFPRAMMGAEHIHLKSSTDPSRAVYEADGSPYPEPQRLQGKVSNMLWPFRLFVDHETKRTRMMTHRGEIWEMGSESAGDLGDECTSGDQCMTGHCVEGYCCDQACNYNCSTCAGEIPGVCDRVPAGTPDRFNGCGTGECAGVCGTSYLGSGPNCQFTAGTPCGEGASCVDGVYTPQATCEFYTVPFRPTLFKCIEPDSQEIAGCEGGLSCQDDATCKTSCTSRADCSGRYSDCDLVSGTCTPDAVSILASSMGIEPAVMGDLELLTPQELAIALDTVGYPKRNGVYTDPSLSQGGIWAGFDPELRSPIMGFRYCALGVLTCISADDGRSPDECFAGAPRCSTPEPWQGTDPQGWSCCPDACLLTYLEARESGLHESEALSEFVYSGCYPGLPAEEK